MAKTEKITYPLEAVQLLSKTNMSNITTKVNQLLSRVGTVDDESAENMRVMLRKIISTLDQIKEANSSLACPAVLSVEESLLRVIEQYSENFREYSNGQLPTRKLEDILQQIVDIRYSMATDSMDADQKRSWKNYKKIHKGMKRSALKVSYQKEYQEAMVESGKAIIKADMLSQAIVLFQANLMIEQCKNQIAQYNAQIDALEKEYSAANADRKEQIDDEYNELLQLIQDQKNTMSRANGQKERYRAAERLLKAQQDGKTFEQWQEESGITDEYLSGLAQTVAKQIKRENTSIKQAKEAVAAYDDAMAMFNGSRAGESSKRPSMADRIRTHSDAELDGVLAGTQTKSERPSIADRNKG